jgi:glycosyltransferase involved in cell wall biosynthesis
LKYKQVDLLALKWDSYDKDFFIKDALSYSKNSILVFRDFDFYRIYHKPDHIKKFPLTIGFRCATKGYFFHKLLILFNMILTQLILPTYLCICYRPKVCVTDSPLIGTIFGIAKKLGICQSTIYIGPDWFLSNRKKNPIKHIGISFLFYYPDYLAVSLSDLVIDNSPEVRKFRKQHWGGDIVKQGIVLFPVPIQINGSINDDHRNNICFLGAFRECLGLNILLSILPTLNKKYGTKVKLFGPDSDSRDNFQIKVKEKGLEDLVEFYGWVDMKTERNLINDCFCGVNLLGSRINNHSIFVTPGKLIHYMQNLIPPLITEQSASPQFIELLKNNDLGRMTGLNSEEMESSIEYLFKNQQFFRDNLRKYALDYPNLPLNNCLEIIKTLS